MRYNILVKKLPESHIIEKEWIFNSKQEYLDNLPSTVNMYDSVNYTIKFYKEVLPTNIKWIRMDGPYDT
jgi:hypothetical protein